MQRFGGPIALVTFLALLYVSARPTGPLPPLGNLLDPANGIWAVAGAARLPAHAHDRLAELDDSVQVLYDGRGVPHIFAGSRLDAIRALGFVVARDRLFQLEIQTRAAAGTLTELVGPIALGADRQARRLGLAWSADRAMAAMDTASDAYRAADAFAQGVNAYMSGLRRRDYPVEYHLLGARPMESRPVHSLYLHRRMSYTLTYTRRIELMRERIADLVGQRAADALFPLHAPIVEPIVPGGRDYPVFDATPLPAPEMRAVHDRGAHDKAAHDKAAVGGPQQGGPSRGGAKPWAASGRLFVGRQRPPGEAGPRGVGSNNWVVGPSQSATGRALLAGDPHLELTLPSIWYETHVVVPDTLDAYGVTIPGGPGIVIGFNRDVAWTFTNTEADVLDYYRETLDDSESPRLYHVDGEWRPLERRVEEYRDAAGDVIATDTIYHTLRGPVLREQSGDYSIRWTALETDFNWESFRYAMEARSLAELVDAFSGYEAPAQNMAMADRAGNIGIRSPGWYPTRPDDGRGDRVFDGSTTENDWTGRLPPDAVPAVTNPRQGYAASANQEPFDPAANPPYLGSDWYAPWRAMRINRLLRENPSVTVEDMRRYQTDPSTARAELFLPALLEAARRSPSPATREKGTGGEGDSAVARAVSLLAEWDRRYTPDNRRAVLFEMAMGQLAAAVWDELQDSTGRRVATPSDAVLWRLIADPTSPWWDVRETDEIETRDEVVVAALRTALERAEQYHGAADGDGWRWDRVQTANIYHLLQIPSFSALNLPVQGGPGALNPSSGRGTFGASWRMVVELGDTVRAWTTYPGGQSGNPVSPRYDDRIEDWVAGRLERAIVPRSPEQMEERSVVGRLLLVPGRR